MVVQAKKKTIVPTEKAVIRTKQFVTIDRSKLYDSNIVEILENESVPGSKETKLAIQQLAKRSKLKVGTADLADTGQPRTINNSVVVYRKITFVRFVTPPYTYTDLARMEAAARRNLCVRTALWVRENATFGKKSKLVIDLPDSAKMGLDTAAQQDLIQKYTLENKTLLQEIDQLDQKVRINDLVKTLAWQMWIFGRGLLIFLYDKPDNYSFANIKRLMPINARRLGLVILNNDDDMNFEGVYVDGWPLDKASMIYGKYLERDITPYTTNYGYSPVEPIMHVAEAHNIALEEDVKEILKSAWLASILLKINTAGLSPAAKATRVQTTIDQINPGKVVGVSSEDVDEATAIDLKPDYNGIMAMISGLEAKMFKALQVPQFLVQSEDIANRATANKAASLFLDGPVDADQTSMTQLLVEQWYTPILQEKLGNNGQQPELDVDTTANTPLPFIVKRVWEKPTVEEFVDLADGLVALKTNGIWDVAQCNKILNTEEITDRVMAAEQDKQDQQMKIAQMNKEAMTKLPQGGQAPIGQKAPGPSTQPTPPEPPTQK